MKYTYYEIQKISKALLNNPDQKTLADASKIILELYTSQVQYQNNMGDHK
jgi:hypothetical protein